MKIVIIALACLTGVYTQAPVANEKPNEKFGKNNVDYSTLTGTFLEYANENEDSVIVANNEKAFIVSGAQAKGQQQRVENAFTIGKLLAQIYETLEWGTRGPPKGFTYSLFGYADPTTVRRKRSNVPFKRVKMTFTPKKNNKRHSEELNQKMEKKEAKE